MAKRFRFAQKLFLLNDQDELLIVRLSDSEKEHPSLRGKWDFPGGGLEPDEPLPAGLKREVIEEIGTIKYKLGVPLACWDFPLAEDHAVRTVVVGYLAQFISGTITLNEEHDQFKWVKLEDLPHYPFTKYDAVAVREFLSHLPLVKSALPSASRHQDWEKYPTGAIKKGSWCPVCKRYNVRNCVNDIMVVKDGKVLLIKRKRNPQKGWWALIGGYLDWDETLEESVSRELKEEIGLSVNSIKFLGVYSDTGRDLDGRQNIGHCFVVTPQG